MTMGGDDAEGYDILESPGMFVDASTFCAGGLHEITKKQMK